MKRFDQYKSQTAREVTNRLLPQLPKRNRILSSSTMDFPLIWNFAFYSLNWIAWPTASMYLSILHDRTIETCTFQDASWLHHLTKLKHTSGHVFSIFFDLFTLDNYWQHRRLNWREFIHLQQRPTLPLGWTVYITHIVLPLGLKLKIPTSSSVYYALNITCWEINFCKWFDKQINICLS